MNANKLIGLALLSSLVAPMSALAFTVGAPEADVTVLPALILRVVNVFLVLVGIVAVVFIIIGGVRYITSQGDEKAAEQAKMTILYAVIGIVAIGLAAAIASFAIGSLGAG